MSQIFTALRDGDDVLFEGACGTGKTLAALTPSLEFAREEGKTVVITTNVHQQARQFVREARDINESEPIQAVVFRGKADMCHVDVGYEECQVLRDNTRELVEAKEDVAKFRDRERELLEKSQEGDDDAAEKRQTILDELSSLEDTIDELRDSATCDHYLANLIEDKEGFYEWLFADVRTPDEIFNRAATRGQCGYELLKEGIKGVDLVICNYHHLLDPTIRDRFFRWLDRDPKDIIAVFDEAHNIPDAARDHATRTLTENTLDSALGEIEETDETNSEVAGNVLRAFRDALVNTYERVIESHEVTKDWSDISIRNDKGRDDLTREFLERYEGQGVYSDLAKAIRLGEELDKQYEEAFRSGQTTT
ncbi:MAG: DEAD/DEAH box helicase, partial [Halobacteriaceae archaeon]